MKRKNLKLAVVGVAALAAGTVGLTSAYASPASAPASASNDSQTGDANLQQGDQTTPDVPGAASEGGEVSAPESGTSATSVRPATAVRSSAVSTPKVEQPSSEKATEAPSAESDGPGGHQDSGNADHQFDGNE